MTYESTRARVEIYFDRTATRTWEALTSDAPVSRIRETVRAGRDEMRALMLSRLPDDLRGARVLDAGCGTGAMSAEMARRGAFVLGVDVSPQLVGIAEKRLAPELRGLVRFASGDMLDREHGSFDFTVAMDSLIYYGPRDIRSAVARLCDRTREAVVFTVAPKTPLLATMWYAGKLFPRSDRSPTMVPHGPAKLARDTGGERLGRIARGFYISEALEVRG